MQLLLEHEIEVDRWEPLAVLCAESAAELPEALTALGPERVPGRFRWSPPGRSESWRYLELDPDGVVIDTLS